MNPPSPERRPDPAEHTKYSPGLLFFYLSCAGVSLGAAIGFGAYKFFDSTEGLVIGLSVSGLSCITTYYSLVAARRPPTDAT